MIEDFEQFLLTLPASEAGTVIPHTGLSPHQLEQLKTKGYEPIDIRFITNTETLIKHAVRGALLGTVDLDANRLKALQLQAQADGLLAQNRVRGEEAPAETSLSEMLKGMGRADTTLVDLKKPIVKETPEFTHQPPRNNERFTKIRSSIKDLDEEMKFYEKTKDED